MSLITCVRSSLFSLSLLALATSAAYAAPTQTLRVAVGADPATLDPQFNDLPTGDTVEGLVYEGLFRLDDKNAVQKSLATDYHFSADGKVLTVKIQTGHVFSNGDPLDAAAVVTSFNRLLSEKNGSIYRGIYTALGTVKAVGDDTIEFHMSAPNGHVLLLLANESGSIVNVKAADKMGAEYGHKPIGSGPYLVDSFIGGESYRLVPNPKYQGDRPAKLKSIDFTVVPEDASRMALLETGDTDIVERVPPESVAQINALSTAKVIMPPSMFSINMEIVMRGPLQDLRVRKAMNLAIDRAGIIKGVLGGMAIPSVGMVGPGTQDSLRKTFEPIPFDPAQAKKLLAEAGYGPGKLAITLTCPTGRYIKDAAVCQAVAGSLQNVGIKATAHVVDRGTWTQIVSLPPAKRPDNLGMLGRGTAGMDYTLYRLFHTGVSANTSGFSDPKVDALLDEGRATTDPDKQKQIYGEIQTIVWQQMPFIFLWYQNQALGVSNKVQGFKVRPDETMDFDQVTLN
ncbi:ABC transporter substrate-binding protein [Rouxiella sp. T17]|uniref:ABC transporter substrate-binding protein n=1 Tax=Rouxiella sp. T17 TaxID=3085684 RepID=UPI002FCC88C5